jgi:PAS domain S-box-containing protein
LAGGPLGALLFAIGIALTLLTWRATLLQAEAHERDRFAYHTDRIREELESRLEGYADALHGVAGLIGAQNTIDRAQWQRYFARLDHPEPYPGRRLIAFAPRIATASRAAHEAQMREQGAEGYAITGSSPGAAPAAAYPLTLLRSYPPTAAPGAPMGLPMPTALGLGYDLAADPLVAEAMRASRRDGRPRLAGPMTLSPSQAEADQLWALLVPAYAGEALPTDDTAREATHIGFVLEVFNTMETAGSSLGADAARIGLRVLDGDTSLFTCAELQRELAAGFQPTLTRRIDLQFGERRWVMEFTALPKYLATIDHSEPGWVLGGGLVVSALAGGLLGVLSLRGARAAELVRTRTTELREALEHSEASETRLRAVVDHVLEAIITIDDTGTIQGFNPAAEQIFGWREAEVRGRAISMLMPEPDRSRHDGYLQHYLAGGPARVIGIGREVDGLRKDGSIFPMELGVSEMRIGTQRLFCGIVRDITTRRRAEAALRHERETLEQRVRERTEVLTHTNVALEQEISERRRIEGELVLAREQALAAADAKAGFLANMSHEIRTPMNAVIGMTALLEETPLDAEQRNYVDTIRTSGDALLAIINDILDFSKIESGMLELEHRPFEVGAVVEEAFDMLAPRAAEKGIDLLYVLDEEVPHWVSGDAMRLRQVLVNLLSNAVKFTEQGEVCLTATLVSRGRGSVELRFAVRDSGIGIPAGQRSQLFKPFSQADTSTTRRYGGTGLGLAICARLVRLMRGQISVDSAPERGSTFTFTIVADEASGDADSRYAGTGSPELAGRRVLLVDDNLTNLHILATLCRRWGIEYASASGAEQTLAQIEAHLGSGPFDIAVLDLHMPGLDGIGLAREIRARCAAAGRPAPALVLLSSGSTRRNAAQLGELFDAHLGKPFKHTQLHETLRRVLAREARATAPSPAAGRLDAGLAQRLPMRILVAEDSAINQKLAVGILGKLGYDCTVAGDGAEALAQLRRQAFDLVLMDLQMPEIDGLEATRQIMAMLPPQGRPRIIAMTANALPGDRERCLAAGMDDYLAKPILPVDLQAMLQRWAPGQPSVPARFAPAHDTRKDLDLAVLRELRSLDEDGRPSLLDHLIDEYLAEVPRVVDDLRRLVRDGDLQALKYRTHKLAGMSASLGAVGVAEACRDIERQLEQASAVSIDALAPLLDTMLRRFEQTREQLRERA